MAVLKYKDSNGQWQTLPNVMVNQINVVQTTGTSTGDVMSQSAVTENLHSHTNKTYLDGISGNVGTMAYENASSYSSATEVNTALDGKSDTATTYTKTEVDARDLWVSGTSENAIVQKGGNNIASGEYSVAEGYSTSATSDSSHAEGSNTAANGTSSHAEGYGTTANGDYSHAEGINTSASGDSSHAEGNYSTASGDYSHAEGYDTIASGDYSHAEGDSTSATTDYSHAEGSETLASGNYSHAEGGYTTASGYYSHAEGSETLASGDYSHAEGDSTSATNYYSHAEGYYTITLNESEHASGRYNVSASASTDFGDSGNTLFSVGNGTYNAPHNAFEIRQNGDIYITSGGTNTSPSIKLQDYIGIVSAVTVNSNMSNVTCPDTITGSSNTGAQAMVIYENGGTTTDYTITVSTSYKSPDGSQISITCPKNGYCEVNYVNINGTIYARGA